MDKGAPAAADVVVVGGGVMGASAAFHLAEAGVDVVLVERGDLAGGRPLRPPAACVRISQMN